MAKISRGKLSTPISILRATNVQDESGDVISTFAVSSQTFCEWLPVSASAAIQAKSEGVTISAKLHVDLNTDINLTDKVKDLTDHQVYDVLTIMSVPIDNKKIVICEVVK